MSKKGKQQCEGLRRYGGAFSFGPPIWVRCGNDVVVMITVEQDGKKPEPMPACKKCWQEVMDTNKIKIVKVEPN